MPKKLCKCGNDRKNHQPCPNCSRYKLVFLLKDPNSHFKIMGVSGEKVNPAIWSFLKEDKFPVQKIKEYMIRRAKKNYPDWVKESRKLGFFDKTGNLNEIITL